MMRIIKYETGINIYGCFTILNSGFLTTKKKHDNSQLFNTNYVN